MLYITNVFEPTLLGIVLMFGIGNAFDSIVSGIVYWYMINKEKSRASMSFEIDSSHS